MKKLAIAFMLMIFVLLAVSCSNENDSSQNQRSNEAAADIPEMCLRYTLDGAKYTTVPVSAGTASWTYDNGDETAIGIEQDGMHPLDSIGHMPEIKKTSDLKSIEITFTNVPASYTVRCWNEEYAGNAEAYEKYYEIVEAENSILTLPDDGQGHIYEVHARWGNGGAYYSFYITTEDENIELQ